MFEFDATYYFYPNISLNRWKHLCKKGVRLGRCCRNTSLSFYPLYKGVSSDLGRCWGESCHKHCQAMIASLGDTDDRCFLRIKFPAYVHVYMYAGYRRVYCKAWKLCLLLQSLEASPTAAKLGSFTYCCKAWKLCLLLQSLEASPTTGRLDGSECEKTGTRRFPFARFSGEFFSGRRGIRTPGTSPCAGFQDRCNRPLYHPSSARKRVQR